jgi:hypothetical protein
MAYSRVTTDTLCWSCERACGGCDWSCNLTPIPDWQATPTKIQDSEHSYESYLVHSCPLYEPTTDYYDSEAQLLKVISNRTGYKAYSMREHREEALRAYLRYSKKYPRSKSVPEEERNACLKLFYEDELRKSKEKRKLEKMSKKSKKIEKNC